MKVVSVLVAGRGQQVGRCPCCITSRRPKKCSVLISCIVSLPWPCEVCSETTRVESVATSHARPASRDAGGQVMSCDSQSWGEPQLGNAECSQTLRVQNHAGSAIPLRPISVGCGAFYALLSDALIQSLDSPQHTPGITLRVRGITSWGSVSGQSQRPQEPSKPISASDGVFRRSQSSTFPC
jgi:hypothetical protein